MIEQGWERDSLHRTADGQPPIRWWLYVFLEPGTGRRSKPRRGVVDRGFRFARGGRVWHEADAQAALARAARDVHNEWVLWSHQPSHALGPRGELIPLDEVASGFPELGV